MRLRTFGLCIAPLACGVALSRNGDGEPAYEIRITGDLVKRGRGSSSNDTQVANPSTRTRRLTITWQLPSCNTSPVSITISNHHGNPIYAGPARCEPFVVPIPAVEHVNVHLSGRGDYDLILKLE